MSPQTEVKLSKNFKIILEIKKSSKKSKKEKPDERSIFISGMTNEKVVLEQDIWASQVELIDKITCFLKVDEEWKKHKISDFFTGKKAADNNVKKKDRMVKSFSFNFSSAEQKGLFEKDLSDINP